MNEIEIWNALNDVKDPEIPVVSLVEMGFVVGRVK
jgi:metal-sulfur cluster biosynthetic enzyme